MAMKLRKNLKAVSPLIATIILIAITIAGGLLVYALFTSTAGVGSAKAQVQIDTMDLVKPTIDNATFTITVKNGGNKPTENVTVTLAGVTIYDGAQLVQPGQTVAYTKELDPATLDPVIGNAYLVVVEATYLDGSSSSIVASVSCRG
jgi:flagellin-like protein